MSEINTDDVLTQECAKLFELIKSKYSNRDFITWIENPGSNFFNNLDRNIKEEKFKVIVNEDDSLYCLKLKVSEKYKKIEAFIENNIKEIKKNDCLYLFLFQKEYNKKIIGLKIGIKNLGPMIGNMG